MFYGENSKSSSKYVKKTFEVEIRMILKLALPHENGYRTFAWGHTMVITLRRAGAVVDRPFMGNTKRLSHTESLLFSVLGGLD